LLTTSLELVTKPLSYFSFFKTEPLHKEKHPECPFLFASCIWQQSQLHSTSNVCEILPKNVVKSSKHIRAFCRIIF